MEETGMEDLKHSETWRVFRIQSELVEGFETLNELGPAVAVFGSSRLNEGSYYYEKAVELGRRLSDAGFAVITGGGPGIMDGANKGANQGKGKSVGLNIELPAEQTPQQISGSFSLLSVLFHTEAYVCQIFHRIYYIPRRVRHDG